MRLTELVRRQVTNFSRAEWNLPLTEFAERLGLPIRPMSEIPTAASTGLDAIAQNILARAAQRYAGLWLLTHSSFTGLATFTPLSPSWAPNVPASGSRSPTPAIEHAVPV